MRGSLLMLSKVASHITHPPATTGNNAMLCCCTDSAGSVPPAAAAPAASVGTPSTTCNMRLFGHRGASAVRPENTPVAFEHALSQGADGVECDLHLLSDGQIIVLHDDTLRRTAGAGAANAPFPEALLDTPVEELAYADLKDVDVGGWMAEEWAGERILLLEGFLDLIAKHGRSALLELKGGDDRCIAPAAAIASRAMAAGLPAESVIWISFDLGLMKAMKAVLPACPAYYVVSQSKDATPAECIKIVDAAADAGLTGVDFCALPSVTKEVVSHAAGRGLKTGVWVSAGTSKSTGIDMDCPANWDYFNNLGVDFFTSDLPDAVWTWRDKPHL